MSVRAILVSLASVAGMTASLAAPVIGETYYEDRATAICNSAFSCRINFTQLPASTQTMVRHVHCYVVTSSPLRRVTLSIAATLGGTTTRTLYLEHGTGSLDALNYYYSFNVATQYVMGKSKYPTITAFTHDAATINPNCVFTADRIAAP